MRDPSAQLVEKQPMHLLARHSNGAVNTETK